MRSGRARPSPTRWPLHSSMFPTYYVGILRSAELTGNLDVVLEQLAGYIERDLETTRAIKSALIYPAVILVMSIGTVILLVTYVLAEVQDVLQELPRQAAHCRPGCCSPSATSSSSTGSIVLGVAVAIAGLPGHRTCRRKRGKRARDQVVVLHAPADQGRDPVRRRRALLPDPERDAQGRCPGAGGDDGGARSDEQPGLPGALCIEARDATLRGEGISRPIADTELFPPPAREDAAGR